MSGRPKYSKNQKCYELNANVNCEEERAQEMLQLSAQLFSPFKLLCVIFRMFVGWFIYYLFSRSFVCCFVKLTTLN